jgi:hypothetical protein
VSTQGPPKCKRGGGLCSSAFSEHSARGVYNAGLERCYRACVRVGRSMSWMGVGSSASAPSACFDQRYGIGQWRHPADQRLQPDRCAEGARSLYEARSDVAIRIRERHASQHRYRQSGDAQRKPSPLSTRRRLSHITSHASDRRTKPYRSYIAAHKHGPSGINARGRKVRPKRTQTKRRAMP